jgi:hypothetical protein
MNLDEVLAKLQALPPKSLEALKQEVAAKGRDVPWVPNPGPQTDAYFNPADETFYGGEAGGGKTALVIGLSLTEHKRSLLLRRVNKDALKLVPAIEEVIGHREGYNGQLQRWLLPGGRHMDIAGCEAEIDKQRFKGDPHDLINFDEITDFLESQYRFIIGWNRSTIPRQRCRVVVTGNPPTTTEGLWVIKYWAPWLDPTHPNPAKQGELRWFTTVNGRDTEVDGPGPHIIEGEKKPVLARSRTFIRATLTDNPDLAETNYDSVLAALPEEIRRAYRDGRFDAALKDNNAQVIPTDWIIAAQNRWKPNGHVGVHMTAMALDPAGGGQDSAELAMRYGGWYAPLESAQGPDTADGSAMAALVIKHRRNTCPVVVDVGGGYGGAVTLRLSDNGVNHAAFNGANGSSATTRDGKLRFANRRAEAWWKFREELDPDQEGGSAICLPPDAELRADLAAPTWRLTARGIQVESKRSVGPDGKVNGGIVKRLGRSPGKGDAAVMCLSEGARAVIRTHFTSSLQREQQGLGRGHQPQVVMGRRRR